MAGVISTGSLSLCLMLLLITGCFLCIGYRTQFSTKEATLVALVACTGLEIYSVVLLLLGAETDIVINGFIGSIWLDVLFVMAAIVYGIVDRESESTETTENIEKEKRTRSCKLREWLQRKSLFIVRFIGGAACTFSLGLFLFFLVTTVAGANKLERNGEMVYLLQNCEDTSLVLTLTEDKEPENYKVSFEKYEGTDNQKVQLLDAGDGMYQIVFLESDYALEVKVSKNGKQFYLSAAPIDGSFEQRWSKVPFDAGQSLYTFNCAYGVPLCYEIMSQAEGIPEVAVKSESGGYEFFTVKETARDEFIGNMVARYHDEFAPTMLMETLISYMGAWSCILFIFIILAFGVILYMRKVLGDKLAALNAIIFAYLLAYGAISAMALFVVVFVVQCIANGFGNDVEEPV